MPGDDSMTGPGYFRWNAGAWFGGQFGGTSWLLVGAAVLAPRAPIVAGVWLACFAASNAVGAWLWGRRDRLRPHPALQLLLLACGAAGLVAFLTLDALRPEVAGSLGWAGRGYRWLLIVPAIMAWFFVLEHATRVRARSPGRP